MSDKLLVIVIIVFKHYPSTYCLMQGSCFICSNVLKKYFLKTRKLDSQNFNVLLCLQVIRWEETGDCYWWLGDERWS